jgi:glycosyltransferase involved in cell wall biosynthesis
MKIVLATGIYLPDIGGPATYVRELARALAGRGEQVTVLAYGEQPDEAQPVPVYRASRRGGVLARWRRYSRLLASHGASADIVYCFSSVSCGVPLWMARLRHPRTLLRLGGDFFWERYTDRGGVKGLREWYESEPWIKGIMNGILKHFDHIVFSTMYEDELYERFYPLLPLHSVIENALPQGVPVRHTLHAPMRLLYLGRFVAFKNLGSLILALHECPGMSLTLVGEGPLAGPLRSLIEDERLADRVTIHPAVAGDSKQQMFLDHDLLVLPSLTELSPNTALEARAAGLPVLLTQETGLSRTLADAFMLRPLRGPAEIAVALREAQESYPALADRAAAAMPARGWDDVAEEHLQLFRSLL